MQAAKVLSIQSLERGLQVLEVLRGGKGLQLHELHRASGVPKASLLRILKTLGEQQCVARTPEGAYYATPAWSKSARRPPGGEPPAELPGTEAWATGAQGPLQTLRAQLPWPSDLGVPAGKRMRVAASNRPSYGRGWRRSVVGLEIDMLDSALGRTYLAFCGDEERARLLEQLLADEPARRRRREAWEREIALTRQRGFGSRDALYAGPDSHHDQRLSAIAVPVLVKDHAVACLSCVWDTAQATRAEVLEACLAPLVRVACAMARDDVPS